MKIPLHKNCTKGPSINDVRSGVGKSLYECLVYVNIHKGKNLTSFMDAPYTKVSRSFLKKGRKATVLGLVFWLLPEAAQPISTFCNFWQHVIFIKSSKISPPNFLENNHSSILLLYAKIVFHFLAFSNF